MEYPDFLIEYAGVDILPQLPGVGDIEINDDIALDDGSDAYTGMRITSAGQSTEYEVFCRLGNHESPFTCIDIVPLDSQGEGVCFEVDGSYSIEHQLIRDAAKLAFHEKARRRAISS